MTDEEYQTYDRAGKLPDNLVAEGWHFCSELDYALVNREDVSGFCRCYEVDPGPQKQPASVARIEAQRRAVEREMQ